MKQAKTRRTAAWIAMLAAVTIALPLSATTSDANAAPPGAKLPKHLAQYKSPLPPQRNKEVINAAAAKYGPGKKPLPRFKAEATVEQRRAAITGINNIAKLAKADPKASALIKDSVKVWEAMTPLQRNEVLTETDTVVAMWPVAVAATAAAVTAGVAVLDLAYKVYVDQREEAEEDAAEGDADDDDDGGDGGDTGTDTGAIKTALGY